MLISSVSVELEITKIKLKKKEKSCFFRRGNRGKVLVKSGEI